MVNSNSSTDIVNSYPRPELYFAVAYRSRQQQEVILSKVPSLRDVDIIRDMKNAWDNFIDSGQVWALAIGLVLGYMFRSLTSY